jgi:hypothetical protein
MVSVPLRSAIEVNRRADRKSIKGKPQTRAPLRCYEATVVQE